MPNRISSRVRKTVLLVALAAIAALLTAGTSLGALVNGTLPAAGYTYTSVIDNSVNISGSGITLAEITKLELYVGKLSTVANPTAAQAATLAKYQARLADYQARYAASLDLRARNPVNVKTTYTRQAVDPAYRFGWHYHNGPAIVTVTTGTLTYFNESCGTFDLTAGHTYIEATGEIINAKVDPAKNVGIPNVEWFTTRLYPDGAADPVPVDPAPCTP